MLVPCVVELVKLLKTYLEGELTSVQSKKHAGEVAQHEWSLVNITDTRSCDDDGDDDDDDDDDELFLWYGWPAKGVCPSFQPGPLSEIFTVANLQHAVGRIWT